MHDDCFLCLNNQVSLSKKIFCRDYCCLSADAALNDSSGRFERLGGAVEADT